MTDFFIGAEAQRLADRPYSEIVFPDLTTDVQPIYIAESPEFLACTADGDTVEEALAALKEVRALIIQHYLEHNVPVPEPQSKPVIRRSAHDPRSRKMYIITSSLAFRSGYKE